MKAVAIFSGGMDSTVLLAKLLSERHEVKALSVDYGQRHKKEIVHAATICAHYDIEHRVADLSSLKPLLKGSSQTDDSVPVPYGHYEEPTMKATVVPNRNMLMLSVAAAWAVSMKFNAVAYGAHAGDHAVYPDCRGVFAQAMHEAMMLCDYEPMELWRPFVSMSKTAVCKLGGELNAPLHLTWSCYEGGMIHCGRCGTCNERAEAFRDSGVSDPTNYRDVPITA